MTPLQIPAVTRAFFAMNARHEGERIEVALEGNADLRSVELVDSFLTVLHSEVGRLGAGEVVIDLRQLEFMSSTCFKLLVTWLSRVDRQGSRYRITFLSNPALNWQRRSLEALSYFAADLVTIQ